MQVSLIAQVDAALSQRAKDVAAEAAAGHVGALSASGTDSSTIVQVIAARGRAVVASSANVSGEQALFDLPGSTAQVTMQTTGIRTDPGRYRVAVLTTRIPSGSVTVYAARSTSELQQGITQLVMSLLVGCPVLVALLGVIAWMLVGRALRPVEMMRRQVAGFGGGRLNRRLSAGPARDELQRLATTFNGLLNRIETSTEQQRQFLADAAHELRSPVASIQTRLEVWARRPELPMESGDRRWLSTDAARLASLVDSLLSLARLDAHVKLRAEPVDLDDLIFDQLRRARMTAIPRIDATDVSGAQATGDRAALDRVVANLLDNAVRHAAGVVSISLHEQPEGIVLVVSDDGPGILAGDRERVFERFTRLDPGRSRDRGGAGLGLAIVRDIVHAHGGTVRIQDNAPGARFVVTLPAATGA